MFLILVCVFFEIVQRRVLFENIRIYCLIAIKKLEFKFMKARLI